MNEKKVEAISLSDVARCSVAAKDLACTLANINYISLPDSTINHFTGLFYWIYAVIYGKICKMATGCNLQHTQSSTAFKCRYFSLWLFNPFKATYPTISNWVLSHHAVKLLRTS